MDYLFLMADNVNTVKKKEMIKQNIWFNLRNIKKNLENIQLDLWTWKKVQIPLIKTQSEK